MSQVFSPFTNTFSVSLFNFLICTVNRTTKSERSQRKNRFLLKGTELIKSIAFWHSIGVPDFILSVIRGGCRIPFISTPPPYHYKNNSSALKEPGFVTEAVSELLCDNRVEEIYLSETWRRPHARTISLPLKPDTCFVCTVIC